MAAVGISAILRPILAAGLIAGVVAGSAVTAVQMLRVEPLILAAERYEAAAPPAGHHDQSAAPHTAAKATIVSAAGRTDEAWSPQDGLERTAFTWLANGLAGIGFGLVLAAVIAFAGRPVDARRGLLWGVAGYMVFAVAPALGLPPELPGMAAADLAARQSWWLAAAGGAAGGLALIAFAPATPMKRPLQLAGLALMALPHLIGAPHVAIESGPLPAELAARFVVASLAASAVFWAALGVTLGHLLRRLHRNPEPGVAAPRA